MANDFRLIKAADAALTPPIPDPTAAAAALMANQTYTTKAVPVQKAAVHGILFEAPTGDWLRIVARSQLPFSSGYPDSPAASDAPIAAAKLAVELATSDITVIDIADWPAFLAQIAILVQSSDVSVNSQTAITALGSIQVPQWSPDLTAGDIQTARAQP